MVSVVKNHAIFLAALVLSGAFVISNGLMVTKTNIATFGSCYRYPCHYSKSLHFSFNNDNDQTNKFILNNQRCQESRKLSFSFYNDEESTLLDEQEQSPKDSYQAAVLVLFTVPLAWGTFEPAVRFIYQQDDTNVQIPALVFSLAYYFVASATLGIVAILRQNSMAMKGQGRSNIIDLYKSKASSSSFQTTVKGGLELGTYLFLGNGLQVWGLATTPSDRAAFLLQLTTLFVPLFSSPLNIPRKTWIACGIALFGVFWIGLDGENIVDSQLFDHYPSFSFLTQGDFFIVLAAVTYTFHCIRLERYAKQMSSAVELGLFKAMTEFSWTAIALFLTSHTKDQSVLELLSNTIPNLPPTTFLAILWIGIVTIAYTIVAQSYGQSRVIPTEANLIYTIQPVFTAILAWALLGESLGPAGYVGGGLIGVAVYLVVMDDGNAKEKHG